MSSWIDHKYISILSSRLRNYKRKSSSLYNFSCPFCGDSKENLKKARGYIFEIKGSLKFHCHNCNATMNIKRFVERLDPNLYTDYLKDAFVEYKEKDKDLTTFVDKLKTPKYISDTPLKKLKKISQLPHDHKAKQYIVSRQIPNEYHRKIFLCPNFYHWVNEIIPGKFAGEALKNDQSRLVIPFINKEGHLHALQGRTLADGDHHRVKYITIMLDESVPRVYGLDTVDMNFRYYTFEGPFDSMFIKNSIATAGGDLATTIREFNKERNMIVYDNEPRSKETIKKIERAIEYGLRVTFWPEYIIEKDVNDMVKSGMDVDYIKSIIDNNSYCDMEARLHLANWRKV